MNIETSLYTLLQILSLTLFEKISLQQALTNVDNASGQTEEDNQLNLFDY